MAFTIKGVRGWKCTRDDKGFREYKLTYVLVGGSKYDGPTVALSTPGLPLPGSNWLVGNDVDLWVWCRRNADVKPLYDDKHPGHQFSIEYTFTNKPLDDDREKCQDEQIEDPLLEPPKISGSFIDYNVKGFYDRFGDPIKYSSWEKIDSVENEWDAGRPQVQIEQNVPLLQFPLLCQMIHTVNGNAMWGFPPRCVKLSNITWERKLYGTCYFYYTRSFTFDIRYNTFDVDIPDEGTRALRGKWDKDPNSLTYQQYVLAPGLNGTSSYLNPRNFQRFKDWNGENTMTPLDGRGRPWDPGALTGTHLAGTGTGGDTVRGIIHIEKYEESDFFTLGIPTSF